MPQPRVGGRSALPGPEIPIQPALFPGIPPRPVPPRREGGPRRKSAPALLPFRTEVLLAEFQCRVEALGCAPKTARDYASQLRSLLRIAKHLSGTQIGMIDLFGEPKLLGRALAHATKFDGVGRFSGYSTDGRRHAARKFAVVFASEIAQRHGEGGELLLDRALRAVYRRVGSVYRALVPGIRRRGGPVASPEELDRLYDALDQRPGMEGLRDLAAVRIMIETGCRINDLRRLDAADCYKEEAGTLRVLLPAKGRWEPVEYRLTTQATRALKAYVQAFNVAAPRWGLPDRVRFGEPGPVWRSGRGRQVTDETWRTALTEACEAASIRPLRPHDLRRTFATQAESRVGRYRTALAGWWDGTGTMDRHYLSPQPEEIDDKMRRALQDPGSGVPSGAHPPTVVPTRGAP